MMKSFSLFLVCLTPLLWCLPRSATAQSAAGGIYLVIGEYRNGCSNPMFLIHTPQHYCLSESPLIPSAHFESVGAIESSAKEKTRYFRIQLDAEGSEKLEKLSSVMKGRHMGLVVQGKLVCIPRIEGLIDTGLVEIAEDLRYDGIENIHRWVTSEMEEQVSN